MSTDELLTRSYRGEPVEVLGLGSDAVLLDAATWSADATLEDDALLRLCHGTTVDLGCGPGRLTRRLADLGLPALGVDRLAEAVRITRSRGVPALQQDLFAPLPAEGQWDSLLLADGNVGIGGDPVRLLRRAARAVRVGGRVVVEVDAPGAGLRPLRLRLQTLEVTGKPFAWAVVGAEVVIGVAAAAGLETDLVVPCGSRWYAVLRRPPAGRR